MEGGKKKRMVEALVMSSLNTGEEQAEDGGCGSSSSAWRGPDYAS